MRRAPRPSGCFFAIVIDAAVHGWHCCRKGQYSYLAMSTDLTGSQRPFSRDRGRSCDRRFLAREATMKKQKWSVASGVTVWLVLAAGSSGLGCPPDLDGNFVVDGADLAVLLGGWGGPGADLDGNGVADAADLSLLLDGWGPCGSLACASSPNDCCLPSPIGTPFCSDTACCDIVCPVDVYCCSVVWDGNCAWVALNNCEVCQQQCTTSTIDCCTPGPGGVPGCSDELCCEAICAFDYYCCLYEWDSLCAQHAQAQCPGCQ